MRTSVTRGLNLIFKIYDYLYYISHLCPSFKTLLNLLSWIIILFYSTIKQDQYKYGVKLNEQEWCKNQNKRENYQYFIWKRKVKQKWLTILQISQTQISLDRPYTETKNNIEGKYSIEIHWLLDMCCTS